MHKSGFVNIIGNPNVGKSTLMNALVGERLSIITNKSQTTRHRIMGIVNGEDFQIVYSDTPGILTPHYKMQEAMMKFVSAALVDADIILYVTDVVEQHDKHSEHLEKLKNIDIQTVIVVNKIDLCTPEKLNELVERWHELLPKALIFPTSALQKFNLDALFKKLVDLLPEGHAYYDKDQLTDRSLRFFASEIIREKILLNYDKEIPYSTEVVVDAFQEEPDMYRISAIIYVARESQKAIIIGHQGKMLKKTGTEARKDMETFFDKKVFLQTFVKVNSDWRDSDRKLREFGYIQE
ncbi:MAG: GTPase Era [Prevotellaceae bacterium]|jgi:GTP-binding protein Era|nr:GTPase Era [Prevotellaceae bacterium]